MSDGTVGEWEFKTLKLFVEASQQAEIRRILCYSKPNYSGLELKSVTVAYTALFVTGTTANIYKYEREVDANGFKCDDLLVKNYLIEMGFVVDCGKWTKFTAVAYQEVWSLITGEKDELLFLKR